MERLHRRGAGADRRGRSGNPVYTTQTVTHHHPTGAYWVNAVGYALIEEVSIEIGSQDIDTMWGEWAFIWEELTQRPGSRIKKEIRLKVRDKNQVRLSQDNGHSPL